MEKMKTQIRAEIQLARLPFSGILLIFIILAGTVCKWTLQSRQPLIIKAEHPVYPVYLLAAVCLILFFTACISGYFFERKVRSILKPLSNAAAKFDFCKADYWQYALLFSQAKDIKQRMENLRGNYFPVLFISRIFWIFTYAGVVLCLCTCGAIYGTAGIKGADFYNLGITLLLCVYLAGLMYFLQSWYPAAAHMRGILFVVLLTLYVLGQYIPKLIQSFYQQGINSFWTGMGGGIREKLNENLFLLLAVFFYISMFVIREKKRDIWERFAYYERFARAYCGFAGELYEVGADEEAVRFLRDVREEKEFCAPGEEKMEWLRLRQEKAGDYLAEISEEMFGQFAPVFERVPEWGIQLLEYSFVQKTEE